MVKGKINTSKTQVPNWQKKCAVNERGNIGWWCIYGLGGEGVSQVYTYSQTHWIIYTKYEQHFNVLDIPQ